MCNPNSVLAGFENAPSCNRTVTIHGLRTGTLSIKSWLNNRELFRCWSHHDSREKADGCSITEHRSSRQNCDRLLTRPPTNVGTPFVYLRPSHNSELRNKKLFRLFRSCRQANSLFGGGVIPTVHHTDSLSMAVHTSHSGANLLFRSSILLLAPNAICFVSFFFILMWTESPHAYRRLDYHRPLYKIAWNFCP